MKPIERLLLLVVLLIVAVGAYLLITETADYTGKGTVYLKYPVYYKDASCPEEECVLYQVILEVQGGKYAHKKFNLQGGGAAFDSIHQGDEILFKAYHPSLLRHMGNDIDAEYDVITWIRVANQQ